MILLRAILAAAVMAVGLGQGAKAQPYPSRVITLVVPFAAGGGGDAVARVLGEYLGPALGGRIIIENKPGANATIGTASVARAAPDGYTLLLATATTHSVVPFVMKNLPYDPVQDFTPLARIGDYPFILVTSPTVPANSLGELIGVAKAQPGSLSYGHWQATNLVAADTLRRRAGLDLLKVPYRGAPQAMTDLLAGRLSMTFVDLTTGLSNIQAGTLKAIAVAAPTRTRLLPDLPTVSETAGLEGYDIRSWAAVFGPSGLPPEITGKLSGAILTVLARPEVQERFRALGFDTQPAGAEELGRYIRSELVRWKELTEASGLQPE